MIKIGGIYKTNTNTKTEYFIPLAITDVAVYYYILHVDQNKIWTNDKINKILEKSKLIHKNFWYYSVNQYDQTFNSIECGYLGNVNDKNLEKLLNTLQHRSAYIDGY